MSELTRRKGVEVMSIRENIMVKIIGEQSLKHIDEFGGSIDLRLYESECDGSMVNRDEVRYMLLQTYRRGRKFQRGNGTDYKTATSGKTIEEVVDKFGLSGGAVRDETAAGRLFKAVMRLVTIVPVEV